jgi:diguanylate cyclase (GGDEF)-like protein
MTQLDPTMLGRPTPSSGSPTAAQLAAGRILAEDGDALLRKRRMTVPTAVRVLGRAADFLAVAATPRFRASQRGRMRSSAAHSMVLIILSAIIDCLWLAPVHPSKATTVIALNGAVAAVAAAGLLVLSTKARRQPELVVLTALVAVDAAALALAASGPEFGVVAGGYLLLLPTIVALLIPWSTRFHIGWLSYHTAFVLIFAVLAPQGPLGTEGRQDLVVLLLVVTAVSLLGHAMGLGVRVVSFIHIERIRALNRQARRDASRLDRLNQVLEHTAQTDALTGLNNRFSLTMHLGAARSRIARHGDHYGILAVDLDRFKAINDSLGHVAGDGVLRAVSTALVRAVRPEDGVYRYGGEEFVVLLRVTNPDEALRAAERIRDAVAALGIHHPGNPPHDLVTISIGVGSIGPDDLSLDDDAWYARADAALYRAKANGRNRCESAVGPGGERPADDRSPTRQFAQAKA